MKFHTALVLAFGMFFLGIAISAASIDRGPSKTASEPIKAPTAVEYEDPTCEMAMR